jgi:hypothetical protein
MIHRRQRAAGCRGRACLRSLLLRYSGLRHVAPDDAARPADHHPSGHVVGRPTAVARYLSVHSGIGLLLGAAARFRGPAGQHHRQQLRRVRWHAVSHDRWDRCWLHVNRRMRHLDADQPSTSTQRCPFAVHERDRAESAPPGGCSLRDPARRTVVAGEQPRFHRTSKGFRAVRTRRTIPVMLFRRVAPPRPVPMAPAPSGGRRVVGGLCLRPPSSLGTPRHFLTNPRSWGHGSPSGGHLRCAIGRRSRVLGDLLGWAAFRQPDGPAEAGSHSQPK